MHYQAYAAQCNSVEARTENVPNQRTAHLSLFALAFGSFCIGTSEFASMGILQLFAGDLGLSLSSATNAVTAYAFGVVIGAPLITLAAARLNRRTLLLCLMALFVVGNLLSAAAQGLGSLALARFVSGLPQGAYFGAGAVVAVHIVGAGRGGQAFALVMTGLTVATIVGSPLATFFGQNLGWRNTYLAVAGAAALALLSLWVWTPRSDALKGGPLAQELASLRRFSVWLTMLAAALGVASIFAVYTFIGPMVTDLVRLSPGAIPIALALFGLGMTAGNMIGGRLADRYQAAGLVGGFASALVVLAVLALRGETVFVLFPAFFCVGMTMMTAIPTIQVRLTRLAPEAPTLMGAMNLAALNVANALGAWAGGAVIALGHGLLSAVWSGFALTLAGLAVFLLSLARGEQSSQNLVATTQKTGTP